MATALEIVISPEDLAAAERVQRLAVSKFRQSHPNADLGGFRIALGGIEVAYEERGELHRMKIETKVEKAKKTA